MARALRILITIPNTMPYYINMGKGLISGFSQLGFDCVLSNQVEDFDAYKNYLDSVKPEVVLEINKTRNQSADAIPRKVFHIAWIQDSWLNDRLHCADPSFGGSQIIYTLSPPVNFGLLRERSPQSFWDILYTGVDDAIFQPRQGVREERIFSLCGYIPPPMYKSEERKILISGKGKHLTKKDMYDWMIHENQASISSMGLYDLHKLMLQKINSHFGKTYSITDLYKIFIKKPKAFRFFDTQIPRIPDRAHLIEAAAAVGGLEIFGPDTWNEWPQYKLFYKNMIDDPVQLSKTYQSTRINLHHGAYAMHPRVLECMGSGGAIVVNASELTEKQNHADISSHFEMGRHYIEYTNENATEVLKECASRPLDMQLMGKEAARLIHNEHLWIHRARKIITDIKSL